MNVGRITAKHASERPDAEAIVDVPTGRRVTFGELDELVRRSANALRRDLGLDVGDRVAVLSRNSVEYVALYLAGGRGGTITQPLNWRLSVPELARVLADGAPRVVVVAAEFADVAAELRERVTVEHWLTCGGDDDTFGALVAAASDAEPPWTDDLGDDDPLFILYTGGTTGLAKGVVHTHRSVSAGMINQTVAERILPDDVYLLTGQMFHIPIVLALNYLQHGRPVVLINFEPRLALEVIQRERVSAFLGITTMLNWMMAVEDFEDFDLSSLRNIQYGGGPMPSSVVRAALAAFPCTLIQGYGQTEGTTMTFLSQEVHTEAIAGRDEHRLRSCGRSAFLSEVRVVDLDGDDVPRDGQTAGEVIVRSEANMLRYWNRVEETARTLRDGWLWTGDLATWDEDRFVYIVDRAKDMIISGGENIYSAQVEDAIGGHPAVLECAVIGVPDDEWGESVKAAVVLKPGRTATAAELIAFAGEHLASYQKPRSVDFVDALPKAPTGKLLKRVLRDPHWEGRSRTV